MVQLRRRLTTGGLTMIAIGSCIGSGIFLTPGTIARAVQDPKLVLVVWMLGGVIALTGALTFAELAGLFPHAGGVYVYLREAYGEAAGFLYGWVVLLVINTGSLAALSVAFAQYATFFVPLQEQGKTLLACALIIGLTLTNAIGIHVSQVFANLFTGIKLAAIGAIVGVAFFFQPQGDPLQGLGFTTPDPLVPSVFVALVGVLWSMGGWHHASYVAGEAINARRTVPLAMVLGVCAVTATYLAANLAYMLLLPFDAIASTDRVAGDAMAAVIPGGGKIAATAISISVLGTIGIYTMTAPRIYFAMAQDRVFFSGLARIHPRFRTPLVAMGAQALWAVVLVLFWGSFSNLITYVTFMDICFMTLAGISIFIFRKREFDHPRRVTALGYPVVPLVFVVVSTLFVLSTLAERPQQAIWGLAVLASGVPAYFIFVKGRGTGTPDTALPAAGPPSKA